MFIYEVESYLDSSVSRPIHALLWNKNHKEEINVEVKTKGYSVERVIEVIEMLSHSQGFYGRLLREIMYIEENDPEKFESFKELIDELDFVNPVDVVLFFEQ